ncbi:hypothetical protein DZF91_00305 [Actinomadura logoneensis]|uniref:Uncharacterized protein n=1 Tax=Actinomadura logoneensis TaxID=2293572 RepID=A0A372JW44_9ACTN|nr:hypothetical protein [Actinomadura logoneensis]RFU43568.1 hypothetical protein DZF91_00305 [Actinomadura logoneensis]
MAEIIDYGMFAERLKAAPNRWDVLREFHEEWGYAVQPGAPRWDRWTEDEHKAYVRALHGGSEDDRLEGVDPALPIPAALDEWWELPFNSFTHDAQYYETNPVYPPTVRPDPSGYGAAGSLQVGSGLVPPDADQRVCVFMAENQYCNEWGYLAAEAHEPDPRVLVSVSDDEWALQARSISEFFLQLAVQRLPHRLGWSVEVDADDVIDGDLDDLVARIAERMPELGFEPWAELQQDAIVYGGPDVLVFVPDRVQYYISLAGRTPQAVVAQGERLGLKLEEHYLYGPGED